MAQRIRGQDLTDYGAAVARIEAIRAGCGADVNPVCRPILFTHGRPTDAAVVWFHGYTNCPRQFEQLGRRCFDAGYNVYIPLAPFHGLSDRMTRRHAGLTASILARFADESADLGRGLGRRLVVGGLSMGGVLAAWLGQQRDDVALALPIAPALSPRALPHPAVLTFVTRALPNALVWWNRAKRESLDGPTDAYPRYSTRGLGEIVRLGMEFLRLARRGGPSAERFHFLLNGNDRAVDNRRPEAVVASWLARGVSSVGVTELAPELGYDHDLIDPAQPAQKVDLVYRAILAIVGRELAPHGYRQSATSSSG
jgi:pimeloyl-ACP methyl ester carboxylesterase